MFEDYYNKPNWTTMGHKKVCLACRESLNLDISDYAVKVRFCAKCGKQMMFLPHRFRPPKKTDDKAWQLIAFLIHHGFPFQHIYINGANEYFKNATNNFVSYPTNLRDAKAFVEKHKAKKTK